MALDLEEVRLVDGVTKVKVREIRVPRELDLKVDRHHSTSVFQNMASKTSK